jgi:hypothetical protein
LAKFLLRISNAGLAVMGTKVPKVPPWESSAEPDKTLDKKSVIVIICGKQKNGDNIITTERQKVKPSKQIQKLSHRRQDYPFIQSMIFGTSN